MSSSGHKSTAVVTSYAAAQAVRLKKDWQDRYRARAREVMQRPSFQGQFTVSIVGRAGVGKGTLVNHLLRRRAATVSHNATGSDFVAQPYGFDRLRLVDIPGYDGQHSLASNYRSSRKLGRGESGKPEGSLTLEQFVESYKLFGSETSALIFVVNNRITVHDKELMALAVASRKFFCIVRTNADSVARIVGNNERVARLSEMEQEIRKSQLSACKVDGIIPSVVMYLAHHGADGESGNIDVLIQLLEFSNGWDELDLTKNLNIRIFKVSIPWPERKISGDQLQGADLEHVMGNAQSLDFPLLASYLSEPGGLYEELQIHSVVEDLVGATLEPYVHVKKRRVFMEFSEHAVLGTLLPVIGPVLLTFVTTLIHTIRALGAVGLVEDTEKAVHQVVDDAKKRKLVGKVATKEGLATAFEDTLIHIFGKTIFHIAIYDLAILSAETTLTASVPLLGAFVSAAHLPKRYEKIGDLLSQKACMLHELWIMQNITNLIHLS